MIKNEIVVGIDSSPSGRAALQWAAAQARRDETPLRAVHVCDRPLGVDPYGRAFVLEDLVFAPGDEVPSPERTDLTVMFNAVHPRSDWQIDFVHGEPGQVLVEESRHAQLLVIGTREHVGLGRVLKGSVSHFCLSHAACPVVAVPAEAVSREAAAISAPSGAG